MTGTDVEFACNARHTTKVEFYVDGTLVEPNAISYVELGTRKITFKNLQREYSSNVVCISSNEAGTVYQSANLVVYGRCTYPASMQDMSIWYDIPIPIRVKSLLL